MKTGVPRFIPLFALACSAWFGCTDDTSSPDSGPKDGLAPPADVAAPDTGPGSSCTDPLDDPIDALDTTELTLASNFDNGNGRLVNIDSAAAKLTVEPVQINGASNIWWHFRLSGVKNKNVAIVTQNDGDLGYSAPVFSYDRRTWARFETWNRQAPRTFSHTFTSSPVWVARDIPFTYSRSRGLACDLGRDPRVQVADLTQSEGGRAVRLLRITDATVADADKQLIWVIARQHAFESHGSWMAEGLARWLVSAPKATQVLAAAIVYVVPVMDVDNVFLGGAGKNQQPVDLQRCWGVPNQCWMAPNAVIALVDQQIGAHPLAAFVDLHSPGLGQETMTVAIDYSVSSNTDDCPPPGEDCHTAADIAYLGSFLDQLVSAVAAIKGPNTFNRRIQNISVWKSDVPNPGPGLMANRYALKYWMRSTPRGLSVPMEISHYKDGAADGAGYATGAHVTKQGLLDYGRGLGEALLWHLSAQ